jgi:tetratricopeptide (TPR) repeat protein
MEVLYKVTHTDPPPLRKLAPRTPAAVEAVCMKAMEKDPARRYASAFQLIQDLRACLAGEEPPVAWSGRTTGFRRLVRRAGLRAALLAVALLAGGIYWASRHATAQHVARLAQKGQSLMADGRYADADVQFMEAQNLDPSSAAAFLGRQEARRKIEDADQARQAAERARQEDLARQVREALGSLDTRGLKDAAKGGTERLTELIAELLRGGETAETPAPGTVRWEFLSRAPGAEVRVLPLTGQTPVFSGRTPARADLAPGLYRLRYQVAGREERELLLPVSAGPARKLTLDEDGKPVEK